MPALAELLTEQSQALLAEVRESAPAVRKRPVRASLETPVTDHEILETERRSNLERIASAMDAQDAEDEAMLPTSIREQRAAVIAAARNTERVHKPRVAKHQPRVTCTPDELAKADAKRKPGEPRYTVTLSHLSDAELGSMVRTAIVNVTAAEMPGAITKVLTARDEQATDVIALHKAEQAERRCDPAFVLRGFTIGQEIKVHIPLLDLRDKPLGETVPAAVRSPYNKARYRVGINSVLDPEVTTWRDLAEQHRALALHVGIADLTVQRSKADKKKARALAKVLGITLEEAEIRVAARKG